MAVAKTTSARKTAEQKQEKKKQKGALLAVFLILLILILAGGGLFLLKKVLFAANPRLTLREIRVNGTGYWKEHHEELAQKIGLKKGTNLFALDLKVLRAKIRAIPNVDSCSVVRVLPDMVVIRVTERVPRAVLGKQRAPWVLDADAVVMPRLKSMSFVSRLPEISGVSLSGIRPGEKLKKAQCAVDLIMMTVHNFPDIRIYSISLHNPEKMDIVLQYRKFPICRVKIPVKNRGLSFMLLALQSAVINARRMGETRNLYDLSYDGRVVIH